LASPKRQPTALKILKGETRTERLNKNEPKPQPIAPDPPDFLEGLALETWQDVAPKLERLGILTELDGFALAAMCLEWSEYIKLRTSGEESIQVFANGTRNLSPEISAAHKCLKEARAFFGEFGLTPSSRSRLSIMPDNDDDMEGLI